jgi:histidinol-phosphate aminotransferase
MSKLEAVPGVLKLSPYVQGQSTLEGVAEPIKLSSNESSHGPSPAALEAYRKAAESLNRYPDGSQYELRHAIGSVFDLNPDQIICGNGSDELIQLMVRTYVSPGDEVLVSENGFIMSNIHSVAQGAELVVAPERDYKVDVDALLERVTDKTRFCTIANPNNPTGTYICGDELRRLHAGLPQNCLLLIDNAYAEYVAEPDYEDGSELVNQFDNVVMTRTFSKIYGLPSLRIGWCYCPEKIVGEAGRIRTPFNTNGPALAAAAAAVMDVNYVEMIRSHNHRWLQKISNAVAELGIEMIPSVANFYLLKFPDEGDKNGSDADAFLKSRGIIPRPTGGSDKFLRITVGLDYENEAVLASLADYMATGRVE